MTQKQLESDNHCAFKYRISKFKFPNLQVLLQPFQRLLAGKAYYVFNVYSNL